MRIAQVSPLFESVPPRLYGGTERVVSYLTEELVRQGHEVTLFASGDSTTRAHLVEGCPRALRLDDASEAEGDMHAAMLRDVYELRDEFDLIHLHVDDWQLREPRLLDTKHVTTVHGRIDLPQCRAGFALSPELALVSISNAQRAPLPRAHWLGTVYHGLPEELYRVERTQGDYLAFVGRISPEKRVDRAVDIAGRFGMKLKVAAKVDNADYAYYQSIKHRLDEPWVEFVGEVDEAQKNSLLGGAYAFLFPIDWPEPFGLAMIEAMACGTPVIAFRNGSIPEVVDDGVTGFVVDSIDDAVAALGRVATLDRGRCATRMHTRFSARRMALDYLTMYERRVNDEAPDDFQPARESTPVRESQIRIAAARN